MDYNRKKKLEKSIEEINDILRIKRSHLSISLDSKNRIILDNKIKHVLRELEGSKEKEKVIDSMIVLLKLLD